MSPASYVSPRSGLVLRRLGPQQAQPLLDAYLFGQMTSTNLVPMAQTPATPSEAEQADDDDEMVEGPREMQQVPFVLMAEDLGTRLTTLFGPSDGVLPGKWKESQAFFFEFEGHRLWAECEASSRGACWATMVGTGTLGSLFLDDPRGQEFWPGFVDTLMEAMGHPLGDAAARALFPPDSPPLRWRQALRLRRDMGQLLPEAMQGRTGTTRL